MLRYQYQGTQPVDISMHGVIQPGQQIEVSYPIDHPDFIKIEEEEEKKDSKKSKGK